MPELARMIAAIQRQRQFQLAMWTRDYAPTAARLRLAYEDAIDVMVGGLGQFEQLDTITDEAVLELMDVVEAEWEVLAGRITPEASQLELLGAQSGYRFGVAGLNLGGVETAFNQTQIEAIQAAINFVDSAAFQARVASFAPYNTAQVNGIIQTAVAAGINPRDTAALIQAYLVGETGKAYPLAQLEKMTRTIQIWSSREATRLIYQENGVGEWIWWSALDARTCLGCISLHGTIHPSTEVLNDHHNGRCTAIPVTPRWRSFGFDDGGEPLFVTGSEWLERQPDERQRSIFHSKSLFEDWKAGSFKITADNIITRYDNDVYGEMRRRGTDREIRARAGI
jgi:hypothetical protein